MAMALWFLKNVGQKVSIRWFGCQLQGASNNTQLMCIIIFIFHWRCCLLWCCSLCGWHFDPYICTISDSQMCAHYICSKIKYGGVIVWGNTCEVHCFLFLFGHTIPMWVENWAILSILCVLYWHFVSTRYYCRTL